MRWVELVVAGEGSGARGSGPPRPGGDSSPVQSTAVCLVNRTPGRTAAPPIAPPTGPGMELQLGILHFNIKCNQPFKIFPRQGPNVVFHCDDNVRLGSVFAEFQLNIFHITAVIRHPT